MCDEEHEMGVLPAEDREQVQVGDEVDGVQGDPADPEHDHHGDQHAVGFQISRSFQLLALSRAEARPEVGAVRESPDDGGVAEDDGGEGEDELGDAGEETVEQATHPVPGFGAPLVACKHKKSSLS